MWLQVLPSTRVLVLEVSFRIDWQIYACLAIDRMLVLEVFIRIDWQIHARRAIDKNDGFRLVHCFLDLTLRILGNFLKIGFVSFVFQNLKYLLNFDEERYS